MQRKHSSSTAPRVCCWLKEWSGARSLPHGEREKLGWRLLNEHRPIHDTYLPFTETELLRHFAPVAGGGDPRRHLAYYLKSIAAAAQLNETLSPAPSPAAVRAGRQMEKDERFWIVAALLKLWYAPDRVTALAAMLRRCLGSKPPFADVTTWEDALGTQQELFFEANLPSPPAYNAWLAQHWDERTLIPYLRERAAVRKRLEGASKVDALLVARSTGFAVLFEAKVLSDLSIHIEFDVMRNQLARTIDISLERNDRLQLPLSRRLPERTCIVLVTPELFRSNPDSRLYGWLLPRYRQESDLLQKHLPHRGGEELRGIGKRLGWLAWEDFNAVLPGACSWLTNSIPASAENGEQTKLSDPAVAAVEDQDAGQGYPVATARQRPEQSHRRSTQA
jgi:hypothetical protein